MTTADQGLVRDVMVITSIDDHGHPVPLGMETVDLEWPINSYDHPLGLRMRPTNAEYVKAWRFLWGYQHNDFAPEHLRDLIQTKLALQERPDYYEWMIGRLNTDAMIYIGVVPEPTYPADRFFWCPHVDWMLWPFDAADRADKVFVPTFLGANRQRCEERGWDPVPPTLEDYVASLVEAQLAEFRNSGAVAVKFNTAYYRPIRFADVPAEDAATIYSSAASGQTLTSLQDHLFRAVIREAGALGLPVQIHTGLGAKPHFEIGNSNPLLLESVFRDTPRTDFLLLHGGWPFEREAVSALAHENVYLDFSCANLYFYPRALAKLIGSALEWFPEKLIYGTDNHSDRSIAKLSGVPPRPNPLAGWEEKFWLVDQTSRRALALALTGMIQDGEISSNEAHGLALAVLRRNAEALYPFPGEQKEH